MDPGKLRIDKAAALFKTLAHPIRLKLILLLAKQDQLGVSSINATLQIEPSLLSHHLIKMKDRGILSSQRKGKEIQYSLIDPILIEIPTLLLNR